MASYSSNLTLRAKWNRGWALMHAGKTSEGYDLLSGIKSSTSNVSLMLSALNAFSYACNRSFSDSPPRRQMRP